jgi:hypothetical protein
MYAYLRFKNDGTVEMCGMMDSFEEKGINSYLTLSPDSTFAIHPNWLDSISLEQTL